MTERTVNVRARLTYSEYTSGAARVGQSTRQMRQELDQLAAAERKAAAEAKAAAQVSAAAAREKSKAARDAAGQAKTAAAAAKQLGTVEAQQAAEAAQIRATAAQRAAAGARDQADAAKELERAATGSAAAATRDAQAVNVEAKAHADAVASTSRHAALVGGALAAAFAAAEYATLGFDKQMSAVSAASGATAEQLGQLRVAAIQAGQATVFGATDAARAEEELVKAGISVKDILSGGLSGALNLATAGNLDLGRAAEIAASTMTQFKLKGAAVPHIADLLAAGAGKAQGSVEDLGVALKYVGPVAGQMGVSLEETTGTLAELASNGILADQAGTGLRGILGTLSNPSDVASQAMQALGLHVYNAAGNFVGFAGVAGQLHDKLGRLSNAERDAALGQIFTNEQITAARILYAGGSQAVSDWTTQVNDSGYAARYAATRMDNLSGDLEQLKGSLETALIEGGTGANNSLRTLTQTVTGLVNAFAGLPPWAQSVAVDVAGVGGSALLAASAYGTFVPKIRLAREELEASSRAGLAASKALGFLGRIGLYAAGVLAAAEAVHKLSGKLGELGSQHLFGQPNLGGAGVTKITDGVMAQFGDAKNLWDQLGFDPKSQNFDVSAMDEALTRIAAKADDGSVTFRNLAQAIAKCGENTEAAKARFKDLDADLAHLHGSNPKAAALVLGQVTAALKAQGVSVDAIKSLFPQYNAALDSAAVAASIAGQSVDGYTTAVDGANGKTTQYISLMAGSKLSTDGLTEAVGNLQGAVKEASDEYDYFIGKNVDLVTAQADMKQAMADAAAAIKKNGTSLDDNTEAGRKNIDVFGVLITANEHTREMMIAAGQSTDQANLAFYRQADAIRNMGLKAGISKAAMDGLLGKMLGVSAAKVKPTIDANISEALKKLAALRVAMAKVHNQTITYTLNYVIKNKPRAGGPALPQAGARGGIAGRSLQPWTDSRDTIPTMLRPGEAVITPEGRRAAGMTDSVVAALNTGRATAAASFPAPSGKAAGLAAAGPAMDYAAMQRAIEAGAYAGTRRAMADGELRIGRRGAEAFAKLANAGNQSLRGLS